MDHLSAGHAGQRPDIDSFVRDALPGQDRTHPLRVSVCPASVCPKGAVHLSQRVVDQNESGDWPSPALPTGHLGGWYCCEHPPQEHNTVRA
jgi:hypothetical protein